MQFSYSIVIYYYANMAPGEAKSFAFPSKAKEKGLRAKIK